MFRSLDPALIVATAGSLHQRIAERFPDSGLSRVAGELLTVAQGTDARITALRRPRWGLRLGIGLLIASMLAVALVTVSRLPSWSRSSPGSGGIGRSGRCTSCGAWCTSWTCIS